jgi:hypothetical protein
MNNITLQIFFEFEITFLLPPAPHSIASLLILASDENIEYINTEDFKPGGKYYKSSRVDDDNSNSKTDETIVNIKRAEEVLRRNYNSTFKTKLLAQLF